MRFASAVSQLENTSDAAHETVAAIRAAGVPADLVTVFFTAHHAAAAAELAERLWLELDPQALLGCSAEGVIAGSREIERAPGLAVLVGHLPGVRIHPFHIARGEWRQLLTDHEALTHRLHIDPETRALIAAGDPFTTPVPQWLAVLEDVFPRLPLIGGMASIATLPGENALLNNDSAYDDGLVGLSLSGPIDVATVVSQGCRPFGKTFVITRAQQNVIQSLGGRPALSALREAVLDMPEQDRELLSRGLFVGRAISEYRESFARGDFLVRNIMGVDEETGAITIGDYVRVGQTVQFHVRDAHTADEDLRLMLESQRLAATPPAGGLLFSCNGRGLRLFDQPCHDIGVAEAMLPGVPLAGFFAAGEFGPIGHTNFIHGHTASMALFRPAMNQNAQT